MSLDPPCHISADRAKDLRPDFDWIETEGGTFDYIDEEPEVWVEAVAGWLAGSS